MAGSTNVEQKQRNEEAEKRRLLAPYMESTWWSVLKLLLGF